jgi:hypothetical protein
MDLLRKRCKFDISLLKFNLYLKNNVHLQQVKIKI